MSGGDLISIEEPKQASDASKTNDESGRRSSGDCLCHSALYLACGGNAGCLALHSSLGSVSCPRTYTEI